MSPALRIAVTAFAVAGGSLGLAWAAGVGLRGAGLSALCSVLALAVGHRLAGRPESGALSSRLQMFRIADELAQYRAFTRLLRDQGARVTASTGGAAAVIVTSLREMDGNIDRLRLLIDQHPGGDAAELRVLVDAIGAPMLDLFGQMQFQDVTQQQIAFLSRLSLIVDQHMVDLAHLLGDRRTLDRVAKFKEMFDAALDDCVMSSQREDHQSALGLDGVSDSAPGIEMF